MRSAGARRPAPREVPPTPTIDAGRRAQPSPGGLTLGREASASNPTRAALSPLRWTLHYPLWPLAWATGLTGAVGGAVGVGHWALWVGSGLLLLANVAYWLRVRDHFLAGDTNPGVVVATRPTLVAVSTDLMAFAGRPFPVVKVIAVRLRRSGKPLEVGDRVATACLYSADPSNATPLHWIDVDPRPVEAGCDDPAAVSRALASITREEWEVLERHLERVPRPYRPGLFPIGW